MLDLNGEYITVIGGSKGAELASVLYAPSDYVYTGLDFSSEIGSS